MSKRKVFVAVACVAAFVTGLTACESDADVASKNLSKAADQFEINRRIVFFNGITDKYLMSIEGFCSIQPDPAESQLEVICKLADGTLKKNFFGLSDNTAYFVEQIDGANASVNHYRVIFKPETIIPDVDRP